MKSNPKIKSNKVNSSNWVIETIARFYLTSTIIVSRNGISVLKDATEIADALTNT